jgi:hypothetical protein
MLPQTFWGMSLSTLHKTPPEARLRLVMLVIIPIIAATNFVLEHVQNLYLSYPTQTGPFLMIHNPPEVAGTDRWAGSAIPADGKLLLPTQRRHVPAHADMGQGRDMWQLGEPAEDVLWELQLHLGAWQELQVGQRHFMEIERKRWGGRGDREGAAIDRH